MNEITYYKEFLAFSSAMGRNFQAIDIAMESIWKYIKKQKRFNQKLAIFSIAITAITVISRNEIIENRSRIRKLEKKIDELTARVNPEK